MTGKRILDNYTVDEAIATFAPLTLITRYLGES